MHAVIVGDLEEYLAGTLPVTAERRFRAHLETCGECSREVREMREAQDLFACLVSVDPVEPPPGFIARVMGDLAAGPALTFWSIFGDFAFGRRVVFASLLTLAVLGTILVSREQSYTPAPPTPDAVMAQDGGSQSADHMLVTLASYEP